MARRSAHVAASNSPPTKPAPSTPASSTTKRGTGSRNASNTWPGEFETDDMFTKLKQKLDQSPGGNVIFYLAVSARFFKPIVEHLGKAGLLKEGEGGGRLPPHRDRKAVRHRSRLGARSERAHSVVRERVAGVSHRSLSRQGHRAEHSRGALRECACSNRSGGANISTACRSPRPKRSAWKGAASFTSRPARSATCCRTTCSSCSAWSRWNRPIRSTPKPCATRRPKSSTRSSR